MSLNWIKPTTVEYTFVNGGTITYKIVNRTTYHNDTPNEVVKILEEARQSNHNILLRFCYGDKEIGRDWGEKHDTCGYIGRSTGEIKIPLLISIQNGLDGPGILDNCIIKIERKHLNEKKYTEVYRHPRYHKDRDS
jgi:hypothetical protein